VNDVTKIYKAYFGRKFIIPAEYDIMISFAPIRYLEPAGKTEFGKFRFRVSHQTTLTKEQLAMSNLELLDRTKPSEDAAEEENTTPVDDEATGGDQTADGETTEEETLKPVEDDVVILDDSDLPTKDQVKVNWDGETVDDNWFQNEAFKIGDRSITNKEVTQVSGFTIIIIIVITLICMYISWRKRKRIAQEARRASEFVRRSTV
jgi:hypothetical protein